MRNKTKRLTTLALLVAVGMLLSFIESRIPPLVAIPGVKLGLSNVATLFALYSLSAKDAAIVSILRVSLSSLLFGNVSSFLYAFGGALLSLLVMLLLKQARLFTPIAVSAVGGVVHNIAQIGVAFLMLRTDVVLYYLAPLLLSGVITGTVIGIIGGILIDKLSKTDFFKKGD